MRAPHPALRARLALVAALLAACSRTPDVTQAPTEPRERDLFTHLERGRYEPPLELAAQPWAQLADLPLERWQPFRSTEPLPAEERAEYERRTAAGSTTPAVDRDLRGLYTLLPVPAPEGRADAGLGRFLDVRARLSATGLVADTERARVTFGVMQIAGAEDLERVEQARARAVGRLFPETLLVDGADQPREGRIELHPETRFLLLLVELELGPQAPAGLVTAELTELRLVPATDLGLLSEDARRIPRRAPFTLGMELREAVPVPTNRTLAWPLDVPDEAGRVELAVGVARGVPPAASGSASAPAAPAPPATPPTRFEIGFRDAEGALHPLLEHVPTHPERWTDLRLDLAHFKGQLGELVLGAAADERPADRLPLVANLRWVRPATGPARPRNVVLISLDTVRPDHLGAYGYDRATSPRFDALTAEAQDFPLTWSTSAYTLPSHASLFSGQYPSVHGVTNGGSRAQSRLSPFLGELLEQRGYATAGFTGGGFLYPTFGFARGFDRYSTLDPLLELEQTQLVQRLSAVPGFSTALLSDHGPAQIDRWIQDHADEPFFLFAHTYSAHEFSPPARCLEAVDAAEDSYEADSPAERYLYGDLTPPPELLPWIVDRYDGGIRHADELVGAVLDALDQAGVAEHTLVIVTSDHGKELGERGRIDHGHQLHRELVRVPLIVRAPWLEPARHPEPASLIDVLPTVLGQLGIDPPARIQGRDLLGGAGPDAQRELFAEVEERTHGRALRRGDDLLLSRRRRLENAELGEREVSRFDLERDPWQRAPEPADPAELDAYAERLRLYRATALEELGLSGAAAASQLGGTERAHLEALGYATEPLPQDAD